MSSYRFCRTDDIGLLVDALNRCWGPYFPDEPPVTAVSFKRSIRDLQVWCSSCMVAFAGGDPIAVLIGAKRPSATLIHRLAVHPGHVRQGHARHLLASIGSKLAILGPPRLVVEIPENLGAAQALFRASGYVEEAVLTDYVWDAEKGSDPGLTPFLPGEKGVRPGSDPSLVVPITVDDLAANGLLATPDAPWERSVETLLARKDEIQGLAVASDERLEAYLLYIWESAELLALRSLVEGGAPRVRHLLSRVHGRGVEALRFPKVHPAEMSTQDLKTLGFRPANSHLICAATARSE